MYLTHVCNMLYMLYAISLTTSAIQHALRKARPGYVQEECPQQATHARDTGVLATYNSMPKHERGEGPSTK